MSKAQNHPIRPQSSSIDYTLHLEKLLAWTYQKGFGLAVWKFPNEADLHVLIDYKGGIKYRQMDDVSQEAGFIIHPFLNDKNPLCFLKADGVYQLKSIFSPNEQNFEVEIGGDRLLFEEIEKSNPKASNSPYYTTSETEGKNSSKRDFTDMVQAGINTIKKGNFQKIVPARKKKVALKEDFSLGETILKLGTDYPNAFVSFSTSKHSGSWLGATPELLVSNDKEGIFKTVALAGTQHHKEGKSLQHTNWTQKEIEEQALVSRYIINCFKKIRLRDFEELGPKTVKAGNLLHLKTIYTVDTKLVNFPDLAEVMTKLLHPTSAVCGMPKEDALDFIRQHEQFDRKYFSGFLGPVQYQQETRLFVNLRCCELTENSATLYAGAGVTIDSLPEKEWQETNWKCQIIGKYLSE